MTARHRADKMHTSADHVDHEKMRALFHQSPREWEEIFNTITDMITLHDKDFNIIFANSAARKLLGLPKTDNYNEVKCFNYYHGTICPPPGCPSCDCLKTGIPAVFEIFEPHLNMNIEIRALPRFDDKKGIAGVIHIVRDISERKRAEQELRKSREKMRNLAVHLDSVREEERRIIAREIHDELAQALTALKMDLVWLGKRLPGDCKALLDKADIMSGLIDSTIHAVRRISSELRPGLLDDLGLQAAMEWQAREFQDRTGITCEVVFNSDCINLDEQRATTFFRIFQETLTNIVRHAGATRVDVRLEETPGSLLLEVTDNGVGIAEEQISDSKSFGLIGMQERVQLLEGDIKIVGIPGKRTTVSVRIPLNT